MNLFGKKPQQKNQLGLHVMQIHHIPWHCPMLNDVCFWIAALIWLIHASPLPYKQQYGLWRKRMKNNVCFYFKFKIDYLFFITDLFVITSTCVFVYICILRLFHLNLTPEIFEFCRFSVFPSSSIGVYA